MANQFAYNRGSVVAGAVWMFVISLLLFWMPVFGSLLAGVVGGRRAGGVGAAILAVFLPAILVAVLLALSVSVLSGFPLIGTVAGAGVFVLLASGVGPLLLGALIGGLIA
jgi:predicted branched-subunit amino acid permease